MAEDESSTLIAVILLFALGGLIGFQTGVLSLGAIAVGAVVVGLAYVSWGLWKTKMLDQVKETVDVRQRDSLSEGKSLDELWSDLQDWLQEKPREMEIVWTRYNSEIQMLPAKSLDDEVYVFTSIITKLDGMDGKVHLCIENSTGSIVKFGKTHFREQVYKHPFEYVSFVKELRRHHFTSDQMMSAMRQTREGQLPGGYMSGMPVDRSMMPESPDVGDQVPRETNADGDR